MHDLWTGNCGEKPHAEPKEGSPGVLTAQGDVQDPTAVVRTQLGTGGAVSQLPGKLEQRRPLRKLALSSI